MQSGFGVPGWRPVFDPRSPGGWASPPPLAGPPAQPWPLPGMAPRGMGTIPVPPNLLDPVGQTARWVAAARAVETNRPDRLFDDPYAEVLAGEDGATCMRVLGPLSLPIVGYLAVRTRFLDEAVTEAAVAGVRQLVILAAGMDTRAFRLPWPEGMRVFELDRPAVLALKDGILAMRHASPACERHTISADLTKPWEGMLRAAGFDPAQPTVWLTEGLLMYLEAPDVERLLATISSLSAPGSVLAGDVPNPPPRRLAMGASPFGQPPKELVQKFGTTDPAGLIDACGWQTAVSLPDDIAARHQRPPAPPMIMPGGHVVRNHLFRAVRP